jgi:membrane-associated phospholipid phosphatase
MTKKQLADIISYILSPVNNAFYVIIILSIFFLETTNQLEFIIVFTVAFFFLCIMPVIGILIYTKKGIVDIWVSDQKIRTPFYLVAIGGYGIALVVFYLLDQHEFFVLTLAYFFVTITITLSNLKTKISSHTGGLTGPFTALLYLFGFIALPLFLLLPVIIWARMQLNAHSIGQLLGGAFIGSIVTYITYGYFY